MSSSITLSPAAGLCHLPSPFELLKGAVLPLAQLAFELYGPVGGPLVIVLGGISSGRELTKPVVESLSAADNVSSEKPAKGWWQDFVGPDRAVDTKSYRVLSIDYLGGPGGSSSAQTTGPGFPLVTSSDQARALCCLLDDLGIDTVHCLIGSSYGGMVGLAFAAEYGDRLERLVVISAAASSHPMATAWRSLQRKITKLGMAKGCVSESLALARGLAMTTYRSAEEFAERFAGEARLVDGEFEFPVESYLENRGEAFAEAFDPEVFLSLSLSIDLHQVDPRRITLPVTLVAVSSDRLVPAWQMKALAAELAGPCEFFEIDSKYGHDAFLKEVRQLSEIIAGGLVASTDKSQPSIESVGREQEIDV